MYLGSWLELLTILVTQENCKALTSLHVSVTAQCMSPNAFSGKLSWLCCEVWQELLAV